MARKFQLDSSITADIKSVASDSFKDNVKMIEVEKIKPSIDNFYTLSDIEILADDIERQGLKHNLVVIEDKENPDSYFIKSGHRRFTAIQYLISENRYTSNYVPCLIDGNKTKSENMLDLIMLNATTRVMSDSEMFKQYEVLKDILEQLKLEGKKVSGRLRENVANFLNVSPAQVGKIENIKHNAVDEVQEAVENGTMSITVADNIAKLPEQKQKDLISEKDISEITSKDAKTKKSENTLSESVFKNDIETDDNFSNFEQPDFDEIISQNDEENFCDSEDTETFSENKKTDEPSDNENNFENYRQRLMNISEIMAEKIARACTIDELNETVIFIKSQL